jgi:hypothetical protein
MSKKLFDPALGEMIGINELEQMTGIPKTTIRNWRKPDHAHLAKFKGYQMVGARDVLYRLADVELWLTQNGRAGLNTGFIPLEAPNAVEAPLNDVEADLSKRQGLTEIANITSENAYYVWFDRFSKVDYERLVNKLKERSAFYKALVLGGNAEDYEHIAAPQRLNQPEWFTGAVPAMRELYAEMNNYELSPEDIISVPIGQVPPLSEKHK